MKLWLMAGLALVALAWGGCRLVDEEVVQVARQKIVSGQAECVLLTEDGMIEARGRGVSPLLWVYDNHRAQMAGGRIVDKVVGRAAAMIALAGQVRHVHGELVSEDAVELLAQHGVEATYTVCVPRILNRARDGLCPLEQAVVGIESPEEALVAIRKRIAELQAPKGN